MNNLNYIVIDFETANWNRNSACSVGLVRFIDGKESDSISSLIKPPTGFFIKEWTDTIHGICYDDVRNKPYFPEIWKSIVEPFISKTPDFPIVAHNALFDMSVIKGCCNHYNLDIPNIRYFDSLSLSRCVWPELPSHKLTALGKLFSIDYKAHDALEDSRTCGLIVALAARATNSNSLEQLLNYCNLACKNLC